MATTVAESGEVSESFGVMDGDHGFDPDDQSVLALRDSAATSTQESPFRHLLVEPCLDSDHYRTLTSTFPDVRACRPDLRTLEGNHFRIPASRILDLNAFSSEWRRFVAYHTSQAFWSQIAREFGKDIQRLHPRLEDTFGRPLEEWRAVRRGDGPGSEITLECEVVVSTCAATPGYSDSSLRATRRNRLWTGLLQMPAADEGTAAALPKSAQPCDGFADIPLRYADNSFIAFVNAPQSTATACETPTKTSVRRYVEFSAQVNHPVVGLLQRGAAQYEWFRFFQRQRNR